MARVNYEIYFLKDREELERFREDPLPAAGLLTDPVTRTRFLPRKESPRFDFKGRPYFFSADSTLARFQAAPDCFASRKGY